MGNEEIILHFRLISISDWRLMLIRLESGQRHVGDFADVDGLRDLQAVIVLNVRWRIAN
jgi:hypothetical protein